MISFLSTSKILPLSVPLDKYVGLSLECVEKLFEFASLFWSFAQYLICLSLFNETNGAKRAKPQLKF